MLPEEDAIELVLLVHFYGVRSSGGLCMSSLKVLTPAQLTLAQTHFPMMLPVCYSLKSIGLDTDTNTFSNVATSLLTSIFEKQFSF